MTATTLTTHQQKTNGSGTKKPVTISKSDRLAALKAKMIAELQEITKGDDEMTATTMIVPGTEEMENNNSNGVTTIDEANNNKKALSELEKELIETIDKFTTMDIVKALNSKFGNHGFRITMKSYFRPSLGPKTQQHKNYINHITWSGGPNAHQVFHFLTESFGSYLETQEFSRTMFTRMVSGIEKKHISYFFPVPIAGTEFKPIDIFLSKVMNRVNDKTVLQYYIVDARDKELGIYNIRGETLDEVFTRLQERIEDIHYLPNYNKQKMRLRDHYERTKDIPPSLLEEQKIS